jgi:peptidoglycan/LPS O-acetylase OafA/YrhL
MEIKNNALSGFSDSKKHYEILDGLRGVAAILVVLFHILESFSLGNPFKQLINHGYLAVDFFFALSGFVIGYAYDDRWNKLTLKEFFKRRLIRLHPMIIFGMILGALTFYFQGSVDFPMIDSIPVGRMMLFMLIGMFLIPVPISMDIRGWQEMYPLNGPAWSLFFEYIANILYALFIRKFSNKLLMILALISGSLLLHFAITSPSGNVAGGWTFNQTQLEIGFTRLLFPFFSGLLISRMVKPIQIKNAYLWSCLLIIIPLSIPRIGDQTNVWLNGLYEALVIILIFPLVIYIGASGSITNKFTAKLNRFLGNISYPLYITHYPLIYMQMAYIANHKDNLEKSQFTAILVSIGVLIGGILIAWLSFIAYDVPIRRWLTKKLSK